MQMTINDIFYILTFIHFDVEIDLSFYEVICIKCPKGGISLSIYTSVSSETAFHVLFNCEE